VRINNRNRCPIDPLYPYTVGHTEFVVDFFKKFVFKLAYKKSFSMESDVRTQIGLQTEENEELQYSPNKKKTIKKLSNLIAGKIKTGINYQYIKFII
jgi:hypothetical protein